MFKSIKYKLSLFLALLIISVAAASYFFCRNEISFAILCTLASIFALRKLSVHYKKFNKNILFLLNALENGDYSFYFREIGLSKSEKELNQMLNRIKEILTKAKKEVIENEHFLSLIVESVSTGVIILDENNNVKSSNQAAIQLLGLHIFTHLKQLTSIDETFPELFANLQPSDSTQIKVVNEREEMQISLRLSRIVLKKGVMKVITLNNIGNELEMKEMESWVRLIRVMTHEIMNSIAPITSLSETLLSSNKQQLGEETIEALETINGTAKGLLLFVDSYRRFTGIPKPQFNSFYLYPLIEKVIHLESARIKNRDVTITPNCDNNITIDADESQITQVLVNLIKNAVEAIAPEQAGQIYINVLNRSQRVQIDVCNNGDPIPSEVVPQIFIPFFTTKEKGTGIGLSISRYIMRLHGGNLKHQIKDGYTVFSMVF